MFAQCLPGSGKTWLTRNAPHLFVDSDDEMKALVGKASKASYDLIRSDVELRESYRARLLALAVSRTMLCNFDPADLDLPAADIRIAYRGDDYLRHLSIAQRQDLLSTFDSQTLLGWAQSYERHANTTWLEPGEFVASVLAGSI